VHDPKAKGTRSCSSCKRPPPPPPLPGCTLSVDPLSPEPPANNQIAVCRKFQSFSLLSLSTRGNDVMERVPPRRCCACIQEPRTNNLWICKESAGICLLWRRATPETTCLLRHRGRRSILHAVCVCLCLCCCWWKSAETNNAGPLR
jgi:hypothetical protein